MSSSPTCSFDVLRPYARQTFQNRTKIRTPPGWQWLTVPVIKKERGTPLGEIEIDYSSKWIQDHLKGLRYNYETAPFYEHYIPSITDILSKEYVKLSDLILKTTIWAIEALKLPVEVEMKTVETLLLEPESPPVLEGPNYRQNFPGFESGMSILDALFNLGPAARDVLSMTQTSR